MSIEDVMNANKYFANQTKKVYVERCSIIESFEEYLKHRYRDNCYYYSANALMGLEPDDFLVRGFIGKYYHHGWVEFSYNNNEYVFDSLIEYILPKDEWYQQNNPIIDYKKSQKEILKEFLNEKNAIKTQCRKRSFWQFNSMVMNGKENSISEYEKIDSQNGYIPSAFTLARLVINEAPYYDPYKIERFIAYSPPSC